MVIVEMDHVFVDQDLVELIVQLQPVLMIVQKMDFVNMENVFVILDLKEMIVLKKLV